MREIKDFKREGVTFDKLLRWKYPLLKLRTDDYVRKLVRITKEQAKWRLKKFVIMVYDNLERKSFGGLSVVDILDEKELSALIDNIYTRGETYFYGDLLWNDTVKTYILTRKISCIKTAHIFLKQALRASKPQRDGVLARRLVELLDFTYKNCVYDVKFLEATLKKYKS